MGDGLLDDGVDCFADADVAEGAKAVGVPVGHLVRGVVQGVADGCDAVGVVEGGTGEGAAHVACCAEDLD